jgi:hypothetical protein
MNRINELFIDEKCLELFREDPRNSTITRFLELTTSDTPLSDDAIYLIAAALALRGTLRVACFHGVVRDRISGLAVAVCDTPKGLPRASLYRESPSPQAYLLAF